VPIFRRLFGRLFSLASTAADSSLALRASSDERDLPGGRVQPRLALAGQPRRMSLRGSWGDFTSRGGALSTVSLRNSPSPKSGRSGAPISTRSVRPIPIAFRFSDGSLKVTGIGGCVIFGDGDFHGGLCAGGIGLDFHGALKLADTFAHTADADAGTTRAYLAEAFGGHAGSVVADLGGNMRYRARQNDPGFCRAGVAVNVGKGFLNETEDCQFEIAGKPAKVVGDFNIDGQAGPFGEASGVPTDGSL